MLFVVTGNGKGKTTSALGMLSRALGHGKRCAVLQFIKSDPSSCGEYSTFSKLGVLWENYGEGFTWQQVNLDETCSLCVKGWQRFKELALSKEYDFIVLDEFTYVLEEGFLDKNEVLSFLKSDALCDVVITGRRAQAELVELASTVSEINEVKHHYNTNGHKTVAGIDF